MLNLLKKRWEMDDLNIFESNSLLDFSAFWQMIGHPEFKDNMPRQHAPVPQWEWVVIKQMIFSSSSSSAIYCCTTLTTTSNPFCNCSNRLPKTRSVLAIKITVYRLAKRSRITEALLKAAENGKHVSVLFEVKARFDEENNIREAQRLQKAGCFVIYGISQVQNPYQTAAGRTERGQPRGTLCPHGYR